MFYFGVGVLLVFAGTRLVGALDGSAQSTPVLYTQLALGLGLFALSFRFDRKRRRGPGPVVRWRDRVTSGGSSVGWLVGLALLAALAEVATMLPYLGAVGLVATADLAVPTVLLLLAGYCLVMVLPAGAMLAVRAAAPAGTEPLLRGVNGWLVATLGEATGWILGIAGFLVARDAAARLFFDGSG